MVGLLIGRVIRFIRFRVNNPPLEVTIAFLTGYIAFLPAAALGVSGVLAVVTAGVYMGWHTPELTNVDTRLQGDGFWQIFSFLLNALLFGLVGLQLRPIVDQLHGLSWEQLLGYARAPLGRRRRRQVRVRVPDRVRPALAVVQGFANGIRRRRGSSSPSSAGPGCAAA